MIDNLKKWFADTYQAMIDWFNELIDGFLNWLEFLPLTIYEYFLDGILATFNFLQPPDFIQQGLQSTVSMLPPDIGYFLAMSGFAQGLAIYGSALISKMTFRLISL